MKQSREEETNRYMMTTEELTQRLQQMSLVLNDYKFRNQDLETTYKAL